MNKDIIHKAIENPELTLGTGVEDLEKISAQYPFFGAAQLLLTKAYQRTNDYRYTDQLHQAAVYSADRKHLYEWIKAKHETPVLEVEQQIISEPVAKVEAEKITVEKTVAELEKPAPVAEIEATAAEVIVPADENVAGLVSLMLGDELPVAATKEAEEIAPPEKAEHVTTPQVTVPEIEVVEEEDEAEETPVQARATDFDPVEKEILLEAMQSSIELEVSEVTDETEAEPLVVSEQETAEEIPEPDSYAAWIYNRSRQVHFSEKPAAKPTETEPTGVSDWQRNAPIAEEETANEAEIETEIPAEESRNLSHGIKKLTPSPQKTTQQDLIDRFIKFEPKITPGKALEYTAGNFAKESLEEDFSFVTETMAILFAQQGKPDKARKAFKKLMELYPEKSVYFAAQLKNLDKYKK